MYYDTAESVEGRNAFMEKRPAEFRKVRSGTRPGET